MRIRWKQRGEAGACRRPSGAWFGLLCAAPLLLACAGCAAPPVGGDASRRIVGLYVYMADAAVLQECGSTVHWPVIQGGDSVALQAAYLDKRSAPGAPALATVEGRIEPRIGPDGGDPRPSLWVERFIALSGSGRCAPG